MVSARNLLYKKPHALPLAPCCKNEREASRLGDDVVPQRQLNLCFRVMSRFQLFHARIWVKPSQFGHSSSYPSLDVVLIILRTHQYSEHIQCAYLSSSRVWHICICKFDHRTMIFYAYEYEHKPGRQMSVSDKASFCIRQMPESASISNQVNLCDCFKQMSASAE